MQARISELESAAEQAKGKSSKLEKDKSRMTMEIKDVTIQLDEVSHSHGSRRSGVEALVVTTPGLLPAKKTAVTFRFCL